MIHYDYYADAPEESIAELIASSRLCRLVTVGHDGMPHLGLFPFVPVDGGFELHLNSEDEQIADLKVRPSCLLEVDEPLSDIPSHWIDPNNASMATAYHRTVAFECSAELTRDPAAIAAQQNRLMHRYQPEGKHSPVHRDDPAYTTMIGMLTALRLTSRARKVKFKLGQNRPFEWRANIIDHLRARNQGTDARSANALQSTIDAKWTVRGRPR